MEQIGRTKWKFLYEGEGGEDMEEGLRRRMFRSISSDFHSKWILDDFLTLYSPLFSP